MAADFKFVQGDTHIAATDQLSFSDGTTPNLTGATVKFQMRSLASTTPLSLTGTTTVTDNLAGKVQFAPTAADTATPGEFMANWLVTFGDGSQMTFPTDGWLWVTIAAGLSASTAGQLVSVPEVKEYMASFGLSGDRLHDVKLMRYIAAATMEVENIVGPVIVRQFDEWHTGGQYYVKLRRRPSFALGTTPVLNVLGCEEFRGPTRYALSVVASPTSATTYSVELDAPNATLYRRTTGGGVIAFGAGPWGGGMPQGVHVVYQAGQQTIPPNVSLAACEIVRHNYQTTQTVGAGMQTVADFQDRTGAPMGGFAIPSEARRLLEPMRKYPSLA